jgi:DNA-binding SARP family transcriptional activator/tetratricopeptide (TPR) repeat protein
VRAEPTAARFAVLGELLVCDRGEPVPVRAAKHRALLAALLVAPNRAVSTNDLVDILWNEKPPANAAEALRTYVMRLRRTLGERTAARLVTAAPGYLLEVAEGEYDVDVFHGALDQGRNAMLVRDWPEARAAFAAASAQWRSSPYLDIPVDYFSREITPGLVAARRRMAEWWAEADMALGFDAEAAARLRALSAEDRFREQTHELLIRALARSGETAAALAAFHEVRALLAEELGVGPGESLCRLQQQVLSRDPRLLEPYVPVSGPAAAPAPAPVTNTGTNTSAGAAPARPTPRQLPAAPQLTGREQELASLLSSARSHAVTVVTGPGGIGKSALALAAAAQLGPRFPDGCLYVSLRGAGPARRAPEDVLCRFLNDLGPAAEGDGLVLDDLTARWRSVLADRAVLIVLDDAADPAQVRPLLPGAGPSRVLVTSRNRLSGLEDCGRVPLPPLPTPVATTMLGQIAGSGRTAAEPAAVQRLVAACGGIPLAIRAAAARLASRPAWSVTDLADRLDDAHLLLDELSVGDLAVRAGFQVSLDSLAEEPETLDPGFVLGALSLCESPVIGLAAVAAATGLPEAALRRVLEDMVEIHLLDSPAPDAYTVHDLTRAFARDLVHRDRLDRFAAAPERLVRWYLDLAGRAGHLLAPSRPHPGLPKPAVISLEEAGAADERPGFADEDAALGWLEREIDGLSAAVQLAFDHGLDEYAWRLPLELWEYFSRSYSWAQWRQTLETGTAAARRTADTAAEAWLLNHLGAVCAQAGRTESAVRHLTRSAEIRRAQNNPVGEAAVHNNLASCYRQLGRVDEALASLETAAALAQRGEDPQLRAIVLTNIAECLNALGRVEQSLSRWREAAAQFRAVNSPDPLLETLLNLAQALIGAEQAAEAATQSEAALDLALRLHNPNAQARALALLGLALLALDRPAEGRRRCAESVELYDRLGGPDDAQHAEIHRLAAQALSASVSDA